MADAEAIMIAAQRPEMRLIEPKSEDQQARAVMCPPAESASSTNARSW